MTLHEFLNALKAIRFIDRYRLPELSEIGWQLFSRAPAEFFVGCDDNDQHAIWRELQKDMAA